MNELHLFGDKLNFVHVLLALELKSVSSISCRKKLRLSIDFGMYFFIEKENKIWLRHDICQ